MKTYKHDEDDGFVKIPHVDHSDETKAEHEYIMRRGNKVLKTYHERIKAKVGGRYFRRTFRKEVFKAIKNGGPVKIHDKHGKLMRDKHGDPIEIVIPKSDLAMILKVKDIEWDVLCGVSHLCQKHADKWSRRNHGTTMRFTDFYDEAMAAVLCAVYSFTKEKIAFVTFAQTAIHRRFLNVTNANKPLSPWSQEGKKLYGQFTEFRNNIGLEVTFDEIIKMMDLNTKAAGALRSMLATVVTNSQLVPDNSFSFSDDLDILNICAISKDGEATGVRLDHEQIVESLALTEWDRVVLDAFLRGGTGWQTEVANNNINPLTGKHYSRRAPRLALNRVLHQIKEVYEKGNVLADAA